MSGDAASIAEIILGAGILNFAVEIAKRFMGRKKERIDVTGKAQEIAYALMAELRDDTTAARQEAAAARREVDALRRKIAALDAELNQWIAWSRMAKREFDSRGIAIAPFPTRLNGTTG